MLSVGHVHGTAAKAAMPQQMDVDAESSKTLCPQGNPSSINKENQCKESRKS